MIQSSRARFVALLAFWPGLGLAAEAGPAAPVIPVVAGTAKPAATLNETQQYCQNIAAAAADARFAWQRKQLTDLDAKLKQRIADLEDREAAFKEVLAHRDEVMKRAGDTVVGIYAHMKPDAAAQQLAALDDETASAILAQLSQKQASTILNEIPAERAAKLVGAITASVSMGKRS